MDVKKAVTVDRKPEAKKKGRKNVAPGAADVKCGMLSLLQLKSF